MTTTTVRRDAPHPVVIGIVVWLSSELLFFGALFGAYFTLKGRAVGEWPPSDVELDRVVAIGATVLLLTSSATMHCAATLAESGHVLAATRWIAITAALGATFVIVQLFEWRSLDFHVDDHAFGTIFYTITGFHGLHVLAGVIAMVLAMHRARTRADLPRHSIVVMSYYWHFVDVVWIAVFTTFYLVR